MLAAYVWRACRGFPEPRSPREAVPATSLERMPETLRTRPDEAAIGPCNGARPACVHLAHPNHPSPGEGLASTDPLLM